MCMMNRWTDTGTAYRAVAALENGIWGGGAEPQSWRAWEHEPITGVWGQSPQWGPGAEPLVTALKFTHIMGNFEFITAKTLSLLGFGGATEIFVGA